MATTADYSLLLFNSVKQGKGFQDNITHAALAWERSTRLQGGYWQGSFEIEGELSVLQDWFYNRMGWHVEEHAHGQTTWEGMIYEMELTVRGVRRRRSLDDMANFIAVTDKYPGKWEDDQVNWVSASRYGRKENFVPSAPTVYLREHAWPWPRPVMIQPGSKEKKATLTVSVCGYAFTLNWIYVNCLCFRNSATWTDTGTWIGELLAAHGREFTTIGRINTNDQPILKYLQSAARLWDFLQELTKMGDKTGAMWRLYVGNGRKVFFEKVDLSAYLWLRDGEVFTHAGDRAAVRARTIRPGVLRDAQYPAARSEPGSMLADARDILIEEVQVDGEGQLSLRTSATNDADILDAQNKRRGEDDQRMKEYWDEAWEKDLEKRKQSWEERHPGVPFDPNTDRQ